MSAVALAAAHRAAVVAGEEAVAAGGNALDAALAAAVMLTVVYPHQCALGGDLVALVRSPDGETRAVIAAGTAPAAIAAAAEGWTAVPKQGAHSVTVPGVVAGWSRIAALGATLPLGPAFAAAARRAREGYPVSAGLARALRTREQAVLDDPGLREIFAPEGTILAEGATVRQPSLAATLDRLAEDPEDFYRGTTARMLVAGLGLAGGVHAEADFAGYAPEVVPALTAPIGGSTWSVAPPPSAGAVLLAVARAGADAHEALVPASIRGVSVRAAHLGDPLVGPVDVEAMLALAETAPPAPEPPARGDTAAVTAIDDEGWAVTIVQSVYQTFGAGLLEPETGIILHNRGSAFRIGAHLPGGLRPGARPPHTLTPAIVDHGDLTVVAGCQGGRAQPWILAQLLPDAADPSCALEEILARPRWVVGDLDLGFDTLTFVAEPGSSDAAAARAAVDGLRVERFDALSDLAGHVQLVRRTSPDRPLEAASDPRADGVGIVVSRPAPGGAS